MARSTAPAVTTEIACSELRPPKTTATRGLLRSEGAGEEDSLLITLRGYLT
ncbi:hypothetical protein GCM10022227_08110 [Streptomyces sedi]